MNIGMYKISSDEITATGRKPIDDVGLILYENIDGAKNRLMEKYDAKPSNVWINEGDSGILELTDYLR